MQKILLNYLAHAEGTQIVRNTTESDITAPYGIYKSEHPSADIFKEIDKIAVKAGIHGDSKVWSKQSIKIINEYIANNNLSQKLKNLASIFYDKYLEDANLGLYPPRAIIARFSLYTNSPKLANKATQDAINDFIKNKLIDSEILAVDGDAGENTNKALKLVYDLCERDENLGLLFEAYMLLSMSRNYAKLAVLDKNRYLVYLNGWNNRLDTLAKFR